LNNELKLSDTGGNMSTFDDISQEEMAVFLQEADEQIQLLDEDLVNLEKEGANSELLQEIFRAAHTLKGSSAMVGLNDMSHVAHAAETVLDLLRIHALEIDTGVIDALLHSLDTLKILRQNLLSDSPENIDVQPVLDELEAVANRDKTSSSQKTGGKDVIDHSLIAEAWHKLETGLILYSIKAEIVPESPFPAVRFFQALDELSRFGKVLNSIPDRQAIENGSEERFLQACFAGTSTEDEIQEILANIPDLTNIDVRRVENEKAEDISSPTPSKQEENNSGTQERRSGQKVQTSQTVRVDVKLLDKLINNVGEMVIERNKIRQSIRMLEAKYENDETISSLRDTSANIIKLVSELQESILQARMLPIGTVFNGFPRLIRDLAQKVNKKVELIIDGQETELDRTILEQIRDPLVHLLRNAVDHGIETPEKRIATGKEEKGVVLLSAYQEQSYITIIVEDDGGGIDIARVKRASIAKGVISEEEAERLSEEEALNLIFRSGISTADQITEVSGRGVGMDVVRTNIESVGGSVSIESRLGEGTRFTIRLPLTLATINGLLVSSSGTTYVIPMSSLVEVLKIAHDDIQHISGHEIIRVRDQLLPVYKLESTFGQNMDKAGDIDEMLVVIIRSGVRTAGIIVDSVMETQETVVKSLGKYVGTIRGIAGATILGDGRVALILDTATLVTGITAN